MGIDLSGDQPGDLDPFLSVITITDLYGSRKSSSAPAFLSAAIGDWFAVWAIVGFKWLLCVLWYFLMKLFN